jgi:hypothetical protein
LGQGRTLARPLYNRSAMTHHPFHLSRPAAAATLTDPQWCNAPTERDAGYFRVWQRVSLALQRSLRDGVAGAYFEDLARFQNRQAVYPVIVYQASRLCHGHPRTEFTYDLRDYPECRTTLVSSWKLTGRAIQAVLRRIELRLTEAGMTELAHRYAPVWHQDVLVAVKKKPKAYVDLLMAESAVINAAIDLGTERSLEAANRFGKTVHLNLRKIHGMDLQGLGIGTLEEATRVLSYSQASRSDNLGDHWMLQNGDMCPAGSPDAWVASQEDGDHRGADGGGQVSDARVVADVDAGRRNPAGQVV